MFKLHLGSGGKNIHGFINVDIRPESKPDLIKDITSISKIWKEEVDLIYACHVLEHFPRKICQNHKKTYFEVLKDWYDALRNQGILRLSVPDFRAVCEKYMRDGNIREMYGLVGGGQKNDFDIHYNIFDWDTLSNDLISVGFKKVYVYDWRQTEHYYIDDYSQSYLPHMDKTNGMLMSLNVEAVKEI